MHRQRILTALILGILVLPGLLWGGVLFFNCLVFLVASLCLYEYYSMTFKDRFLFIFIGMLLGITPLLFALLNLGGDNLVFSLFFVLFSSLILFLLTYSSHHNPLKSVSIFIFGAIYIGLCSSLIALIRPMLYGRLWILFLLIVVFSADTGAYYIGSTMGKHKLALSISKGKTIEGAIGGLFICAIAALISWISFLRFLDPRIVLPLAILIGIVSQIGDLTESMIKRACNKKDSGGLLPGHGGIFDRVDALLLSGPVLFWVLYFADNRLLLK